MADKAASLTLNLKSDGFKKGLKTAEGDAAKSAKTMGAQLSASMNSAASGGIKAVRGMFSTIKSGFGMIAGLAGGIGFSMLVKSAMDAQGAFRRLAFATQAFGKGADIQELRSQLQGLASDTGLSIESLVEGFDDLLTRTGDLEFTRGAMKSIGDTSLATGAQIGTMNAMLEAAHDQFGLNAQDAPQFLAQITALAKTSGMSLEEFAGKYEIMAATATAAGIKGSAGMAQTMAMMKMANDAFGGLRKGTAAYTTTLDKLATAGGRKEVYAKLGVKASADKGSALDAIKEIFKATSGKKEMIEKAFTPGATEVRFLAHMGKEYAAVFEATQGDVKTKTAAAVAAFDQALADAGTSARTAADVEAEAAKAKEDGAQKVAQATEKLKKAFSQPEIVDAITKLASKLPALADIVTKVADLIMKNPLFAGTALVAGKFAIGAFTTAINGAGAATAATAAATTGAGVAATGMGTALMGAAASAGTFALAAGAVAAAVYNANKLFEEIEQQDKDQADERENLMQIAERRGESYAVRESQEKSGWDLAAFAATGGLSSLFDTPKQEILTRGKDGKVVVSTADAGPITVPTGEGLGRAEDISMSVRQQAQHGTPAENRRAAEVAASGVGRYQAGSLGDARAIGSELAGRELKVKITNVQELKNATGKGPPVPGSAER